MFFDLETTGTNRLNPCSKGERRAITMAKAQAWRTES